MTLAVPPSVRGRQLWNALFVISHAMPAAIVWGLIGIAMSMVGNRDLFLAFGSAYALLYGLAETTFLPFKPLTTRRGVPAGWVCNKRPIRQVTVWGAMLGPGLATRNPYAGIWLLPFLLGCLPGLVLAGAAGALVGAAHGAGRAFGIIHTMDSSYAAQVVSLRLLRWRFVDGLVLMAMGCYLLTSFVARG
jgi:hypothetical protein